MKIRRVLAFVFALLLVTVLFTGCGAKSEYAADAPAADAPAADAPMESPIMDMESSLSSSSEVGQSSMPANQKIIITRNLQAQTEDMEPLLASIDQKIAQLGGYVEAQDVYNGSAYASYRYRYAHLTIRIPADNLDQFISHVSANANIVSESTSTENVTLSYAATESRILVLEAERDRLLEFMDQAETMKDMLQIEERLTEVIAELEKVTSQLRVYDNLVNYSTVYLDIEEVKEYTEIEEEPETVWERISSGFSKSMKNVGEGFVNFFVGLVVALPYLIPWVVVAVVVIVIILRVKRRKAKERAAQQMKDQNP